MVSANFWPALGGAEGQALELSRALRAAGAGVVVLTRRTGGLAARAEVKGVPVRRLRVLGTGAVDSLSFLAGALGWLLKHEGEYDAIHAHLAGSPALAAAAAGRLLGKPVVVKLGGGRGIGELAMSAGTLFGRLKLRLLPLLGPRFVAVAADLADEAREFLGPVEVELLPNGVDAERFKPPSAPDKAALRSTLGWGSGPVYLYTGRFSPEKRLPWFVKLWDEAAPKDAKLVLAGAGPEAAAVEAAAASAFGRVSVLPPTDRPEDLLAAADVFVLPSSSEGLSNSLLEAMAAGLCVVASAVGGTPQAVSDGKTGLLFARDDERAAAEAVRRAGADAGLRARLGAAAREDARARFSLSAVAARCLELYRP